MASVDCKPLGLANALQSDSRCYPVTSVRLHFLSLLFLATTPCSAELIRNGDFSEGEVGWHRYEVVPKGEQAPEWRLSIRDGRATVSGSRCVPQARVGFRSEAFELPREAEGTTTGLLLTVQWSGTDVHRSGLYFLTVDPAGGVVLNGEHYGPSGDFSETVTIPLLVPKATAPAGSRMMVYAFHDGIGELTVDRFSLVALPQEGIHGYRRGRDAARLLAAFSPPITEVDGWIPELTADALEGLLPGERRLYRNTNNSISISDNFRTRRFSWSPRETAISRPYHSVQERPFWLTPDPEGALVEVERTTSGQTLPELPADHHARIYFWGAWRYGKKAVDLERDRAELAFLAAQGFTGVCFQDDYGLDLFNVQKRAPLNPRYLNTALDLYIEVGFRSSPMYLLSGGMDIGHIKLRSGDRETVTQHLQLALPHLEAARTRLGERGLLVSIVDEPNTEARRELASMALPIWNEQFGREGLVVTGNWQVAGDFSKLARTWVGAGDFPDGNAIAERQVAGFYKALDTSMDPLVVRRLAGLHAWASGLREQAWWHANMVNESPRSDLDGKFAEFFLINPESPPAALVGSIQLAMLREGIQDWRLLLALEAKAKRHEPTRQWLDALKARIPLTDRVDGRWASPADFEVFRREATVLWRQADTDAD